MSSSQRIGVLRTFTNTDETSPHGLPVDLLHRLLLVPTHSYSADEIRDVLAIRAKYEQLDIADDALAHPAEIAISTSLRYAIQLLTPASIPVETTGKTQLQVADIESVNELYMHGLASARLLSSTKNDDGTM